jgi:fermentation-respiration switch protein FrsA (DUF1100 family)
MRAARLAWPALRIALLLLAAGGAILFFEKRLIYYPYRDLDVTPKGLGLPHEELALVAEDGVKLHGWFLPAAPAADPRPAVLLCHGNAGNISYRLDRAQAMAARLGTDVLLFDYRGYGRSEGTPDEEGTYRDARAAYRWLRARGTPPERVVLMGESLGGAVALRLALEAEARALVLESSFTSVRDMARAHYAVLRPLHPFLRTRYDSLGAIGRLRMPVLVIHGDRDRVVPFEHGERLFAAAPAPKRFLRVPGAGHDDVFLVGGEPYWTAWRELLGTSR